MTEALYLKDSYLKEFEAKVTSVDGKFIVLDRTGFYAQAGGQPSDVGKLIKDGDEYSVVFAKKIAGNISHEVGKEGLQVGDFVKGVVDWDRRHKLMRAHTATHVLSKVFHNETEVVITGNQLGEDKCRMDMNLEDLNRELIESCFAKANGVLGQDLEVKSYFISKDEVTKDPSLVRLASRDFLDKLGSEVRIVQIGDFDKQLDGGTHVNSLKEVGKLELLKIDNRGKNNKRVYFTVI